MIEKDPAVTGWWAVNVTEPGEYELLLRLRPDAADHRRFTGQLNAFTFSGIVDEERGGLASRSTLSQQVPLGASEGERETVSLLLSSRGMGRTTDTLDELGEEQRGYAAVRLTFGDGSGATSPLPVNLAAAVVPSDTATRLFPAYYLTIRRVADQPADSSPTTSRDREGVVPQRPRVTGDAP